jgi:hypothetical protein
LRIRLSRRLRHGSGIRRGRGCDCAQFMTLRGHGLCFRAYGPRMMHHGSDAGHVRHGCRFSCGRGNRSDDRAPIQRDDLRTGDIFACTFL